MSTDRELLELAAKAAGISKQWDGSLVDRNHPQRVWNPLTDDGDALRLAVKLKLLLCTEDCMAMHQECKGDRPTDWFGAHPQNEHVGIDHDECDPFAATRRAIVRAAAEIGRATPGNNPKT